MPLADGNLGHVVTSGPLALALLVSAFVGLVGFASPCVLPLVPGYLSYVTGLAGQSEQAGGRRLGRVAAGAALFVLGFSAVFVAAGALFGQLGSAITEHLLLLERIFGAVTIVLGLVFLGAFGFLQRELKVHRLPRAGLIGAPLVGATFGFAWTPCLTPTYEAVANLAVSQATAARGALLSVAYCIGLGVPFLLIALGVGWAGDAVLFLRRHARAVSRLGGALLVALGVLMVSGLWDTWIRDLQASVSSVGGLDMSTVWFWVRRGWRRLVSMRTALVLLFLLAIASVPGSLLPQKPLNPSKVTQYLSTHGSWGAFLDRLGFFDVFGSVWFSAVYLLLFVSLIGCLVPRIRVHARSMLAKPLPAPRNLLRLPESDRFETSWSPAEAGPALRRRMGRRWRRVERHDDGTGTVTISAEKGYSRETGNLIFHVALLTALLLIAVGRLYHYQGSRLVIAGQSFCNSAADYDSWQPGRIAASGGIGPAPFCVKVDSFAARYLDTGEPTSFASAITYHGVNADGTDGVARSDVLRVNHPLRIGGDRLYLISHGYAPVVTVTMPDGTVRTDVAAFVPTDPATLLSEGAFQERPGVGQPAAAAIGLRGIFAPTPAQTAPGVYTSTAPQAVDPVLGVQVFKGDWGLNSTTPQSVYSLDTDRMSQIGAVNLHVGETGDVGGGVSVRFDGYRQWVALQVSHDPTQGYLLLAAVAMVTGLVGSLSVRRRRVWVRIAAAPTGTDGRAGSIVTVGGLARSDSGNFTEEFAALVTRLRDAVDPPDPVESDARQTVSAAGKG